MGKLLKYELRKTMAAKLILLGLALIAEVFFIYAVNGQKEGSLTFSIVLLVLLATFGIIYMGVQSVLALHRDMNTRQSYMLFMTPNSTYRILGAKMLENGLSTLLAGAFFFALGYFDIRLLLSRNESLEMLMEMFAGFTEMVGVNLSFRLGDILCFILYILCSWLCTVTLAYLADVISSSLLNGKRGGLLISFIIFLVINWGVFKISDLLPSFANLRVEFIVESVYCVIVSAIMYYVTAWMMEKYLSV